MEKHIQHQSKHLTQADLELEMKDKLERKEKLEQYLHDSAYGKHVVGSKAGKLGGQHPTKSGATDENSFSLKKLGEAAAAGAAGALICPGIASVISAGSKALKVEEHGAQKQLEFLNVPIFQI